MFFMFLALVQAATEFLPISSSGHLLFLKGLFDQGNIPVFFDIIVHLGSLTAILLFYRKKILATVSGAVREITVREPNKPSCTLLLFLIVSTVVTFLFYLIFKDIIETRFEIPATLKYTFFFTSLILAATFFVKPKRVRPVVKAGFLLPLAAGVMQGLAIMPGISRSGSTIACLLFFRIKKEEAAYYSFFLAIPAILGAFVFKLSELENVTYLQENTLILLISFVVSSVFSYLFLKLLTFVLSRNKFWLFAVYTLGMAVLSLIIYH